MSSARSTGAGEEGSALRRGFHLSSYDRQVLARGKRHSLGRVELEDLARAFTGGLFVSLPLMFTQEMWTIALTLPAWFFVLWAVVGYFACVGYGLFSGFRAEGSGERAWWEAFDALGVGFVAALVTMMLFGRYNLDDAFENIVRLGLLEMVPTGIGAAVAMNQLGGGDSHSKKRTAVDRLQPDLRLLLGSLLGAFLFAFNIAPTAEPQIITFSLSWWHVLALILFSLASSHLTIFVSHSSGGAERGVVLRSAWVETVVSYLVALAVSFALLVLFGYITWDVPWSLALAWTVLLGYGTNLAGAAGRLIL